jgi:hypothetical protein
MSSRRLRQPIGAADDRVRYLADALEAIEAGLGKLQIAISGIHRQVLGQAAADEDRRRKPRRLREAELHQAPRDARIAAGGMHDGTAQLVNGEAFSVESLDLVVDLM